MERYWDTNFGSLIISFETIHRKSHSQEDHHKSMG